LFIFIDAWVALCWWAKKGSAAEAAGCDRRHPASFVRSILDPRAGCRFPGKREDDHDGLSTSGRSPRRRGACMRCAEIRELELWLLTCCVLFDQLIECGQNRVLS
jgi:hypothetical protein